MVLVFFAAEDCDNYPWGQSGGIDAGLILLQPDECVFERMMSEVTCEYHLSYCRKWA